MKNTFRTRYRIKKKIGYYLSEVYYTVEFKKWFWPFWIVCDYINVHLTIKDAEEYVEAKKNPIMREY